jgi:hypothetical protein
VATETATQHSRSHCFGSGSASTRSCQQTSCWSYNAQSLPAQSPLSLNSRTSTDAAAPWTGSHTDAAEAEAPWLLLVSESRSEMEENANCAADKLSITGGISFCIRAKSSPKLFVAPLTI